MNFKSQIKWQLMGGILVLLLLMLGIGGALWWAAPGADVGGDEKNEIIILWRIDTNWAYGECKERYGIMPCSRSLGGSLAVLVVYGYASYLAAKLLWQASELLLSVIKPGIIGGLLLPIVGAFPDAMILIAAGTQAEAQSQVLAGMGLVAGTSVFLLTLLWASCLIAGRCDLVTNRDGVLEARHKTLTKEFSLSGTGITTHKQTRWASWIMMATLLPYIVAQAPRLLGLETEGHVCIAIAACIAFAQLIAYCVYQLVTPWFQKWKIYYAQQRWTRAHGLQGLSHMAHQKDWGLIINAADCTLKTEVLLKLFDHFDTPDQNGRKDERLTFTELKGLILGVGIHCHKGKFPGNEEAQHWMEEFDTSEKDKLITKDEFLAGIDRWIKSSKSGYKKPASCSSSLVDSEPHRIWDDEAQEAMSTLNSLLEVDNTDSDDEESASAPSRTHVSCKAVCFLIGGLVISAVIAYPLVDSIGNLSKASGISPFFISFIAMPLPTCASEVISSHAFAKRKKKSYMSMAYYQIYGAVTMQNSMCLGIFLAIVYFRGLVWDFSAEVLVVLFATLIIGGVAAVHTTFPLWMALIGLALYPASVGLVAFLDYVCGWH